MAGVWTAGGAVVKRHLLPVPAFGVFGVLVVGFAEMCIRDRPYAALAIDHLDNHRVAVGQRLLRRFEGLGKRQAPMMQHLSLIHI